MAAVAPARAEVNIGEGCVEVSIGFHQIRNPITGKIRIHIVHVHSITQRVIGKYATTCGVACAALVPGQDASHGHAQGDVNHVVRQSPAIGETRAVAGKQPQAVGAGGRGGKHTGIQSQ
jgi:hypothetical protein